ncbi:MAG: hypothetical protein DWQ31_12065 [Planctomycetota bacterium]|nr:MAG: hypothetical protein DWQ31_12065 [Planctomycetota bacterium]REJ87994.1 MAG: hypothetical protein DWQ35_20565 [Planctomycetota bacterium]REK24815.1 MAG: hypothetical protein DWQ42_12815 [Planctomycetota bacterium]REK49426.1 MAG: hypothetical protein DWQ46_00325 [Planctomycetota bacterium]
MAVMIENTMRIPVADLATIRLKCKSDNCGSAAEVPIIRLDQATLRCPVCGSVMRRADIDQVMSQLSQALVFLAQQDDLPFDLEFVLLTDVLGKNGE